MRLTGMRLRLLKAVVYLLLFSPLFLFGQAPISLSNPSACGLSLPLADYTCPDDPLINFDEPNRFNILVGSAPGGILGVDVALKEVRLIIAHEWISDVNVRLISPNGTVAQLIENVGSRDDNFGDPADLDCSDHARLQIYACQSISTGIPPFLDGPYRPIEDLWVFNDGSTDPLGIWQLLICDDLPGEVGTLEYVELVFEPIDCLPVQELMVDRVDSTTAVFTYLPAGSCGDAVIEIGPPGFTPGVGASAGGGVVYSLSNACSPITISGLAPETAFDAYIRRYCSSTNAYSANACPVSFETLCQPPPTTLIENFDTQATCAPICNTSCTSLQGAWRNVSTGDLMDWIVYRGPTPSAPLTGPSQDVTGNGGYVYMEANGSACTPGSNAILQSGCFLLNKQGSDDCHLSFNYHLSGIHIGNLRLQVSTNGGFSWLTIWQLSGNQGNKWKKAYISLAAFTDGAPIQFRFLGTKGNGNFGDLAIDQIVVHGSTYLGYPDQLYYTDLDGDGFGRTGAAVLSCLSQAPAGYANNNQDCNDNPANGGASIYPGAPEIICNGIDENCNQAQIDDDVILPPPTTFSDTICSGELPNICAEGIDGAFIIWYAEPTGLEGYVDFAPCISPVLPPNEGPFPVVYRFYAEQTNFNCSSPVRAEATVVVNPKPAGSLNSTPRTCPGTPFNLNSIQLIDTYFTGANLSWHQSSPATPANQLPTNTLIPTQDTTVYYLLTSPQGCTDEGPVSILMKPLPVIDFLPADSFSLCLESSGLLEASASGGSAPYQLVWGNGATSPQISIQASPQAGVLQKFPLLVTDAEGCSARDTALVMTTNSIDSIRVFTRSITTCDGSDGQITVIPLNGLSPFSYTWTSALGESGSGSFSNDTLRLSNLRQGAYRITLTDASAQGCEVRLRNLRVQGPGFLLGEHAVTPPSCWADTNGSICLNVSGSANLQYTWSNLATTACIDSLPAGNYQVTITNGACTAVESFTLSEPDSLSIAIQAQPPSCPGFSDGSLTVAAFGGTAPYFFDWNNGNQTPDLAAIGAGSYTLTITDHQGCQLTRELSLSTPPFLDILTDTLIRPSCFGSNDGLIMLRTIGGDPPYRYLWDNGSNNPLRTNLATGAYDLTVTDDKNCSVSQTFVMVEPPILQLFVEDLLQPQCASQANGILEVRAEGGTPPYVYYWNGQASADPFQVQLGVGTYTIYVQDSKGCRSADLVVVLEPTNTIQLNVIRTQPLCQGRSDGAIQVIASGGFSPYQINWQGGFTGSLRQNLPVGAYALTITDARSCTLDTVLQLTAPQVFQVATSIGQPSCYNIADGIINPIVVQSGTGLINFQWNDGSQASQRNGLAAGPYQFTLTDAIGCRYISDTIALINPAQISLSTLETTPNACAGDATASLEVALSGGSPPYFYNWVGQGINQALIEGLAAGNYRLLARDSRFCFKDTTYIITDPQPLVAELELQEGQSCIFGAPTLLRAVVSGGTPPYSYLWSNGSTQNQLQDPLPGDYDVFITDANGCQIEAGTVKVRTSTPAIALSTFDVTPVRCFGSQDASLTATVTGGSGLFRFHFSEALVDSVYANTYTLSGLAHSNNYSVTITDLNTGCMLEASAPASQPDPLVISRDAVNPIRCFGGADGQILVSVSGGIMPYQFAWVSSSGDTLSRQEDLLFARDDTYTLWVSDGRGCLVSFIDSSIHTINTPIIVIDSLTEVVSPPCRSEATGAISLTVAGGAPPYMYSWSNGQHTEDISNIPAGLYELTVTDSDTCRRIFPPIQVTQPQTALSINTQEEDISCFGADDGFILLGVFGGGSPYQYTWRRNGALLPAEQGPAISDLAPGDYSVLITDQNNCSRSRFFTIDEPPLLQVSIVHEPPTDTLRAVVTGGTPPYDYAWSNGMSSDRISNLSPGEYTITVSDDNDCEAQDQIILVSSRELPTHLGGGKPLLYPNPTRDQLFLLWPDAYIPSHSVQLQFFNAGGQLMLRQQLPATQQAQVDTRSLPPGVYVCCIQTPSDTYWLRVVILEKS